jgi:hypothetical protein
MKLIPLAAGETIELRHPLGGASPLDLHSKLRLVKMTTEEVELFRQVSQQKAEILAKAEAYSATHLRDRLELAKQQVADQTTVEGFEASLAEVASIAAMCETPAIVTAVQREAHNAVLPELARLDATLIPLAEKLIAEVRVGLDKAAAKFNVGGLLDFIEDQHLGQLASYVADRIAASHALLDAWQLKAASQGAQSFLADDRAAT